MKQQISTRLLSVLPVVLVAASLLAVAPLLFESAPASAALQPSGTITITVKEGFSEAPLEGATVVIPEIQQSFLTDEKGQTPAIAVPIQQDTEYQDILPKPWGEVTILVYYPGCVDLALFHVNVWENKARNGPTILMFPQTGDMEGQPFTMTEGPNNTWVSALLDQYRPESRR